MLLSILLTACFAQRIAGLSYTETFADGRGNTIHARVCVPDSDSAPLPLSIWAHGWKVAAADYSFFCTAGVDGSLGAIPVFIVTPLEGPAQPPDLRPLADAAIFLSTALPARAQSNATSPLHGRLSGKVYLSGHSMGGGTSALAADPAYIPSDSAAWPARVIDAMALLAPGLYGAPSAVEAPENITAPVLMVGGDLDCVNVIDAPGRAVPSYHALASARKTLVVLKGANHCDFTSPVVGACAYDICGNLGKHTQQGDAIELMSRFSAAALNATAWSAWEAHLRAGEAAGRWQFLTQNTPDKKLHYTACPTRCCSACVGITNMLAH